jgi:TolB-like protein/class 3 adenylate cyclase/Flp pilus assembly protein TadD
VPTLPTPQVPQTDLPLEIAHLLLIDIVGYSKLLVNEQIETVQELNRVVRSAGCFRTAEANGKLIRVPTGDGMALLFFQNPEEPVRCALEISQKLKESSNIRLRMGVHSGPVNQVKDVNDTINVAGTGINVAQRVMDCGDAGHILLSKHVADDLAEYRHWQPHLHDLGECEVKHGLRLHVVNLYKDGLGNPSLPEKLRRGKAWKRASGVGVRLISAPRWPKIGLIVALSLSAIALAVSFAIFLWRATPAPSSPNAEVSAPEKSIAVLPFENLSDEKQNTYFTDGVQDEILNDLAKVADLKVISRTSVMQYRSGATRNLREIGKALGVAHIVEGSVQRAGTRVRVSAQLIDARNDAHVWAERYDRELADVFAIESELAEQIVSKLKARLAPDEKAAIEERPTGDLVAYELYARAKEIMDAIFLRPQSKEDLLEAVQLLEKAAGRDGSFLLAYCQLTRAHDMLYSWGLDHTPARLQLADAAVQSALRLAPESAQAHLALARHVFGAYDDYDRARNELAIARRTLPNEPLTFALAGYMDRRQGKWEESIKELKRAEELDPRDTYIPQQLFLSYICLRRYQEATDVLDHVLTITPTDTITRISRAWIDLESRADTQPQHAAIEAIIATNDSAQARIISSQWLYLALCEHDAVAAQRALKSLPNDGCHSSGIPFPRAWCEGMVARLRHDNTGAQNAFTRARAEVEQLVQQQADYAEGLCALGMIDAVLGKGKEAIQEGRRALELCPANKDAIQNAVLTQYLSIIYAWSGEKQLALEHLDIAARLPAGAGYGDLRLHPYWDPLRGDRRFERIVASLAPDMQSR